MKAGCLFILAVMVGSYFGYRELLKGTEFEDQYWLPVVLGVLVGFVIANIQGIFVALKQRSVLNKPRTSWTDGELVGISGRIQAARSPITSPFSGKSAVIGEYEIKYRRTGKDQTDLGVYSGFYMVPCSITSNYGSVKLIGFPILNEINTSSLYEEGQYWQSVGAYLASCKFQKRSANPIEAIKQLNSILTDDDGELRADYMQDHADLHLDDAGQPASAEQIAETLASGRYYFEEKMIPNGEVVTAFGTYKAMKQVIDIGSGLSSFHHTIKIGSADAVTAKAIKLSIFMTLFFALILGGANFFILDKIGYDLKGLLAPYLSIISDS